jgi:hypothetical protein
VEVMLYDGLRSWVRDIPKMLNFHLCPRHFIMGIPPPWGITYNMWQLH